jgi:hypothetical protein
VSHRGPTLGYRLVEDGTSLCYLPDHEPALGGPLAGYEDEWISGFALASEASVLIHDCQYTDAEYAAHRGWGHSAVGDALEFADRCHAHRTLLFHHDPRHPDEELDALAREAHDRWEERGAPGELAMALEGDELEV